MSEDGLTRKDGYRQKRVEVPVGIAVTDRGLVFAAVDGDGSDAGRLAYEEVAGIDVERETLVLTTTGGVTWRLPLSEPESEAVDVAVRHLCWVGEVRNRLVGVENDVELASGKIRTLADDLAWEDALDTYREARARLDELVSLVQWTTPLRDDVLAPELAELDRRLESACARLYVERCRSQLELATQLFQYGDYEQAGKVFDEARGYRDRARWHAEEVKRADAFQFGRQRDLATDLEETDWEIESAAAEPLQQAAEATTRAETADALDAEIEHLESALRRYRGIRTLEWDEYLAENPDDVDEELRETALALIDSHERAARSRWNDGSRLEADGDLAAAIQECTVATEHLERAHELAEEFDAQRVDAFESRLKQMFEMLLDMQHRGRQPAAGEEERDGVDGAVDDADLDIERTDSEETASLPDAPASGERRHDDLPDLSDLADVDLHHDITLDLEGNADPLDLEADSDLEDDPLGVADESGESADDGSDVDRRHRSNETESV